MAQIRKYANGGPSSKYGTFTYDNQTYQVDNDFINQLSDYAKTLDSRTGNQFQSIIDAVKRGENLTFDSAGTGNLKGNIDFNVTDKQAQRMGKARTATGSWFGRSWRGREQQAREAVSALKGFNYRKPQKGTNYDWSKKLEAEYITQKDDKGQDKKDENGRVIRNFVNGARNNDIISRLEHLIDIANYTDDDTFTGYNDRDKQSYIDWYRKFGAKGVNDVISRIKAGTWTDSDAEALNDIGIILNPEASSDTESASSSDSPAGRTEAQERKRYGDAGLNYDNRGIFQLGDDGSIYIVDPELNRLIGTGPVWLNSEFTAQNPGYRDYIGSLDPNGLFVINGRAYRASKDLEALQQLPTFRNFVENNKRRYGGDNQIIRQFWLDNHGTPWHRLDRDSEGNQMYSAVIPRGVIGRDASGEYVRSSDGKTPLVYQYFENYNPEDSTMFDPYGWVLRDRAKTVYIDPITKQEVQYDPSQLVEQTNDEDIARYYNDPKSPTAFSAYHSYGGSPLMVALSSVGSSDNPFAGASLFGDDNGNYYWYDSSNGGDNFIINGKLSGKDDSMHDYIWSIDPKLGKYLQDHPEAVDDPKVREAIAKVLRNPFLSRVSFRNNDANWGVGHIGKTLLNPIGAQMEYRDNVSHLVPEVDKMNPELSAILNEMLAGNYARSTRRQYNTPGALSRAGIAYRLNEEGVPVNKEGGILKQQFGGVASYTYNTSRASKDAVRESDTKMRKAGEAKVIGDGTDLSAADKAEMAALVADAASLGMTFVPGLGNVAGAVTGAAGSLTQFGADVTRDGLDWGDAGNLLLNLGLDVGTLIPGLGTGAKAAKFAKALKKSAAVAKWIGKAVSLGSASAGLVTAWDKIQNGNWTIRDIRTIVNGIRGGANFGRMKGSAKTKNGTDDTAAIKSNNPDMPSVQVKRSELEAINSVPKSERASRLEDLLTSKVGDSAKASLRKGIVDAEVKSNPDLTQFNGKPVEWYDATTGQITDYTKAASGLKSAGIDVDARVGEAVISSYDIPTSNGFAWNWRRPWQFSRTSGPNTGKLDFDEVTGTYRNPEEMSWWNWNRRAAIRDAKMNVDNPYYGNYNAKTPDFEITRPLKDPDNIPISPYFQRGRSWQNSDGEYMITMDKFIQPRYYQTAHINTPIWTHFDILNSPIEQRYFYNPEDKPYFYKQGGEMNIKKGQGGFKATPQAGVFSVAQQADLTKDLSLTSKDVLSKPVETDLEKAVPADYKGAAGGGGGGLKAALPGIMNMGMGLVNTIANNAANKRMINKQKDAVWKEIAGSQKSLPTEYHMRFSDNGLHRQYDNRIKEMRNYSIKTNDANQLRAEQLMRESNVDKMKEQRDTQYSGMISQFNQADLANRQRYEQQRRQIVDTNRANYMHGKAQLDQLDAQEKQMRAQNWNNFFHEAKQNLNTGMKEYNSAAAARGQFEANKNFNEAVNTRYGKDFAANPNGAKDIYSYAAANDPSGYAALQAAGQANAGIGQYNSTLSPFGGRRHMDYINPQLDPYTPPAAAKPVVTHKSGGRVSSRRITAEDADNMLFIEQNKATYKAVSELNKAVVNIFKDFIK